MLRQRASRGVRTPLPFTHSVCGNRQGLGTVRPSDCSSRGSRAVVPWPQFQAIRLGDSLLGLARRGVCSPHRRAERLAASGYGSSTETVAQLGSEKCVARTGPSSLGGRGSRRRVGTRWHPGRRAHAIATWLILPVVICLSQRLSHACLSISLNMVKPRMAH